MCVQKLDSMHERRHVAFEPASKIRTLFASGQAPLSNIARCLLYRWSDVTAGVVCKSGATAHALEPTLTVLPGQELHADFAACLSVHDRSLFVS